MSGIVLVLCGMCWAVSTGGAEGVGLETFPLSDVEVTGGPFLRAQRNDVDYVLSLDPERLLAPYRREAGVPSDVDSYGSWEATGLDGHIGGHCLSALAMLCASTGDQRVCERLTYMVSELKKCQDANGNGYVGGVPGSQALWADIAAGHIDAASFSLNDRWVPWYNLHKVFAGLRDAYVHGGNEQARAMLIKLADWSLAVTANLSDAQMQDMLRAEHGGMNEVLADVAAMTGETKYLELARRFSHREILHPLLHGHDRLTNLHANTQIPKVIGFKRIADIANDRSWNEAAEFFWDTVVTRRTVAIGGNSVREHFNAVDDFRPMITEVEGPETCNTYNMLRLSKLLFQSSSAEKYVDFYETALFNHILSSQHPKHGGLVYFTPMRPQHYRVYSQAQEAMWCCVGSGIENHAKYGELIYAHNDNALLVNLYIPSNVNWENKGVKLSQKASVPDADTVYLEIHNSANFTLKLRYPQWVAKNSLSLAVNGVSIDIDSDPGSYISLERNWEKNDSVALKLPMRIDLIQMPDESNYYAFRYGPIVLAAKTDPRPDEKLEFLSDDSRMGHIPAGALCPLDRTPVLVGDLEVLKKGVKRSRGGSLSFTLGSGVDTPRRDQLRLVPFYEVHDSRYVVYWPAVSKGELEEFRGASTRAEQARLALEAITIDQVAPGEQQPESDHSFRGERTEFGVNMGRHWRHAFGWFSYRFEDEKREAKFVQVTYFGADSDRRFDVVVNESVIASVALVGKRGAEFFTEEYPIPPSVVKQSRGTCVVKFVAHKGSIAGGVYGVRLLREKPARESIAGT